jgi:hypothetical protein
MADLWTAYTAAQSFAIAAMLLLYGRYWFFQVSAGAIPRAVVLFFSDGMSISFLVVSFCFLCVMMLQTLTGPQLSESADVVRGLLEMAGTFITGESRLAVQTLEVRPPSRHRGLLLTSYRAESVYTTHI